MGGICSTHGSNAYIIVVENSEGETTWKARFKREDDKLLQGMLKRIRCERMD